MILLLAYNCFWIFDLEFCTKSHTLNNGNSILETHELVLRSGTKEFMEALRAGAEVNLTRQFDVGNVVWCVVHGLGRLRTHVVDQLNLKLLEFNFVSSFKKLLRSLDNSGRIGMFLMQCTTKWVMAIGRRSLLDVVVVLVPVGELKEKEEKMKAIRASYEARLQGVGNMQLPNHCYGMWLMKLYTYLQNLYQYKAKMKSMVKQAGQGIGILRQRSQAWGVHGVLSFLHELVLSMVI